MNNLSLKKNITKILISLLVLVVPFFFNSCKKDESIDVESPTSLVGEWFYENETIMITYKFNSNRSGVSKTIEKDEYGDVIRSNEETFEYNLSDNNNGETFITFIFPSSSRRVRYEIGATKLLLYIESTKYLEFKKK